MFVASYTATQNEETGKVQSDCVWSKDVVTLLPEADVVHFSDDNLSEDDKLVGSATWDRVVEIVGDDDEKARRVPTTIPR